MALSKSVLRLHCLCVFFALGSFVWGWVLESIFEISIELLLSLEAPLTSSLQSVARDNQIKLGILTYFYLQLQCRSPLISARAPRFQTHNRLPNRITKGNHHSHILPRHLGELHIHIPSGKRSSRTPLRRPDRHHGRGRGHGVRVRRQWSRCVCDDDCRTHRFWHGNWIGFYFCAALPEVCFAPFSLSWELFIMTFVWHASFTVLIGKFITSLT